MRDPRNLRSKTFFLLLCVIMPLLLLGCLGGKSVENNTISQRWEQGSVQKDSFDNNKSHVRTNDTYMRDSVYAHDSVVVVVRNDTVLRDRWHYRDTYKLKKIYLTDTLVITKDIYHFKTDTLKFYVTKTNYKYKYVEKKLTWWQDKKMKLGGIAILSSILLAFLYARERAKRHDEQQNKL